MTFKPNGPLPAIEISSIEDIIQYMGDSLAGFSHIEIVQNNVIGYIAADPTGICIGTVY